MSVLSLVIVLFMAACQNSSNISTNPSESTKALVGADRDEHGCIGSAGYTW